MENYSIDTVSYTATLSIMGILVAYFACNCITGTLKLLCLFTQDYKTYLDFVLALENRKEPQALQYLFRLLDMQKKAYLNIFDINYFFRVGNAFHILLGVLLLGRTIII